MGAERAEAQPQGEWNRASDSRSRARQSKRSIMQDLIEDEARAALGRRDDPRRAADPARRLGWLGLGGYALSPRLAGRQLAAWVSSVATLSAPLILLALVWLLFGRTTRRETERFTERGRGDAARKPGAGERARDRRRPAAGQSRRAERRSGAADVARRRGVRPARPGHPCLARETAALDRKAQALDGAAASARVDIGVLLDDLPRAEEQARAVAEAMKPAGLGAHEQAAALEGHLAALDRARPRGRRSARRRGAAARRACRPDRERRRRRGGADGRGGGADERRRRRRDGAGRRVGRSGAERARSAGPGDAGDGRAEPRRVRAAPARKPTRRPGRAARRCAAEDRDAGRGNRRAGRGQPAPWSTTSPAQIGELDGQFAALGAAGDEQKARLGRSLDGAARRRAGAARRARPMATTESDAHGRARAQELVGGAGSRSPRSCATQLPAALAGGREPGRAHRRGRARPWCRRSRRSQAAGRARRRIARARARPA